MTIVNAGRKNLETHAPFTVTPYCEVSFKGFCVLLSIASAEPSDVYNHFARKLFSRRNTRQ